MIEINELTKRFGSFTAVDRLSFSVKPGEVLGFLGPNGAGKSTTMKMITGFLAPSSGSVSVFGNDILKRPLEAKKLMGYVPEGAPAYADMTVLQFLKFIADVRGYSGAEKRHRVDQVIERINLFEMRHKTIDTLSKGYKRRVGIAQAMLHDPSVLIMDEPTDGLDPNQKHEVRELINELSSNKLVVVSTHILEEVSAICDRAIIIDRGRLIADDTPEALEKRSRYHGAVSVVSDEAAHLRQAMKALEGVHATELSSSTQRLTLFPKDSHDTLYREVQGWLQENNIKVDGLYLERGHLDDVFRDLTEGRHA